MMSCPLPLPTPFSSRRSFMCPLAALASSFQMFSAFCVPRLGISWLFLVHRRIKGPVGRGLLQGASR